MPIVEAKCDSCGKTLKDPPEKFGFLRSGLILCGECIEEQGLQNSVLRWFEFREPTPDEEPTEEEAPTEEEEEYVMGGD